MSDKKHDKTKIVQIWGEILDEGFTSVPNILLRYRSSIGLKPKHIMLIIDIMSYKWDAEYPFPSYSTLARRSGIEERSVKRITQDLEELGLLIKSPRFDDETGAQVTTVFDFRPLVQKLIEEMNRGDVDMEFDGEDEDEISVGRLTGENAAVKQNTAKKGVKGRGDKNVRGEGDKNVTRGVTKLSPGGVTKMSPKEYSYNKKIISKGTLEDDLTYVRGKKSLKTITNKNKERVRKNIKEGIFRKRMFEIYDNLIDVKPIKSIVEEGAWRACKDISANRSIDMEKEGVHLDPAKVSQEAKRLFPYDRIPRDRDKARNFYVGALCELVASLVVDRIKRGAHA